MHEIFTYQPAHDMPAERFTDKPSKFQGTTVYPRWAWSDSYRKTVQDHYRALAAPYPDSWNSRGWHGNLTD